MPGALPPSRPVFYDAETFNGTADLGSLHRKLVQWARWTYGRDAYYKPCNVISGDGNGLGSGNLGSFYVPQPTTPAQRLVLQVYVDLTNAAYTVDLALVGTRGNEKTVRVDSAALGGGGATVGWYEFTFPCAPDSVVEVTATASNAAVNVKSLCGWWEPLATGSGITLPGGSLSFVSRTWAAQDRPDSAYFLQQLAQLANRYAATRPRMVVATSYARMGSQTAGTYEVGRYKVLVGENVGYVDVDEIQHTVCSVDGDFVFKLYEDGSLIATQSSAAASPTRTSFGTVAITKGAARAVEFKITVTFAAGTRSALGALIFESPMDVADLGLASGDAVPGSFPTLDAGAGRGGAAIMATGQGGRAGLLDALIWLYAKRRRVLVDDSVVFGTIITEVGAPVTYEYVVRAAVRQALSSPDPTYGIDAWGWIEIGGVLFPAAGGERYGAPAKGEFGKWVTRGPSGYGTGLIWAQTYNTAGGSPFSEWVAISAEAAAVTVP